MNRAGRPHERYLYFSQHCNIDLHSKINVKEHYNTHMCMEKAGVDHVNDEITVIKASVDLHFVSEDQISQS
jgi:hypothetical protein